MVAVYFDGGEKVQQVANYGLKDGIVINYYKGETPARGKDLTCSSRSSAISRTARCSKTRDPGAGGIPGPGGGL